AREKKSLPVQETEKNITEVKDTLQKVLSQIDVAPLKIEKFVRTALQEIKIPEQLKQEIVSNIMSLDVSIKDIGNLPQNEAITEKVLNEFFKQIQNTDENIASQIKDLANNLTGSVITAKITHQIKDTTWLKTPVGETFFESKVKIPVTENVILNVEGTKADYSEEIKVLDNLIKAVFPKKEIAIKAEQLASLPQLKVLADISSDVSAKVFAQIINKLPMTSDNLLQNMHNFYRAAEEKDITKWLGEKVIKEISQDNQNQTKVFQELQNFVSSSLKETPGWKIVEMPLFDGNQFSNIKIALKKDNQKNTTSSDNTKNGTRFVVETNFSKLGAFQFDGFSNAVERKLDLIIRASQMQEDDFVKNIINLFKKTLYDVNYAGTIKINRQEKFINLAEETEKSEGIYV
ncbi:MAG: hypothetical protein MJ210_06050, partial [Alphaproteobacteria bacterium]|nr:hypothetical protein [Alphaproteobacteria bacterium]